MLLSAPFTRPNLNKEILWQLLSAVLSGVIEGQATNPVQAQLHEVFTRACRRCQVFRMDKDTNRPTTDREAIARFERKLKKLAAGQSARFVSYAPDVGTWVFEVDHFSRWVGPAVTPPDLVMLERWVSAWNQRQLVSPRFSCSDARATGMHACTHALTLGNRAAAQRPCLT